MIESAFAAFTCSMPGVVTVTLVAAIIVGKMTVIDRMIVAATSTASSFGVGRRNGTPRHVGGRSVASGGGRT